jgi:hypothetical protein
MSIIEATGATSLGRRAAVKTFTRNNNLGVKARKVRPTIITSLV